MAGVEGGARGDAPGRLSSAAVVDSHIDAPALEACALAVITATRFEPMTGCSSVASAPLRARPLSAPSPPETPA